MHLDSCDLCPRSCGVNRTNGEKGLCGAAGARIYLARAALHFWEEPCISGENGSGAVFFSGCNLRCVYCQNHEISDMTVGKAVSTERLAEIFGELQEKGALNINLVTPTPYAPLIREAILSARKKGLRIPTVYNTSGYENPTVLRKMEDVIDVYLTDFKYSDPDLAERFSGARNYPEVARASIREMIRQKGVPKFDKYGIMQRGVIVRHLLLPGHVRNGKAVVDEIFDNYGDSVYLSLMNQYTPMGEFKGAPELGRKVTPREYERFVDYALAKGVKNAFIQEGKTQSESFVPAFDYEGVLPERKGHQC